MKILNKISLKNLLNKKNIVTFIAITLTSILLFGTSLAFSTLKQNKIDYAKKESGDYHVIYSNVPTSKEYVLDNPDIEKYFSVSFAEYDIYSGNSIGSISPNYDAKIIEGRMPNEGEVILDANHMFQYHFDENYKQICTEFSIGSDYIVGDHTYKVVGTYEADQIISGNAYTTEKFDTANYYVYMKNYYSIKNKMENINKNFDDIFIKMHPNMELLELVTKDYRTVEQVYVLGMCAIVLMVLSFVCFYVIYNSFSISVMERKKSYAVYKSIGATPKQIVLNVLFETFIIAIIAVPFGFLISTLSIRIVLIVLNNMLNDIMTLRLAVHSEFILLAIFFIFLSIFIAALIPAIKVSKISAIAGIRQNAEIIKQKGLSKKQKLINKLFGIEGVMAAKTSLRNYRKYNVTTFSIVIGCIIFIIASVLINLFVYRNNLEDNYDSDIRIEILTENEDIKNQILANPYIDEAFVYRLDTTIDYEFKTVPVYLFDYVSIIYISNTDYNNLLKDNGFTDGYILLNNPHHEYFDKYFDVDTLSAVINGVNYENIHVIDDYNKYLDLASPTIILPSDEGINNIIIHSKEYKKFDEEIKKIERYDDNKLLFDYNNPRIYDDSYTIINVIKLVIYLIIFFITIITITSIYNTINTNLELRKKEFAILRSIGLDKKGYNKMIFYEAMMLSLKALTFGILISIFLILNFIRIYVAYTEIGSLRKMPYIQVFGKPILICIIMVILIVFLTYKVCSRKFKKINIADVIKEDAF